MTTPNSPIRAVVVDDETLARQYLTQLLKAHPDIQIVAECANGFEAVKAVMALSPDVLFLDIQMPKLDGFEVLELIDKELAVVFVTAYDQYALKAFDSHAVDYLLKPFSDKRLADALEKVRRNLGHGVPTMDTLKQVAAQTRQYMERIVIKDGSQIVVIPVFKVDYIQAEDDYISIHSDGRSILKHQTISSMESALDGTRFVRIHRSTIVNLERIDRVELVAKDRYVVILQDNTELNISRSGHKRLKEVLG